MLLNLFIVKLREPIKQKLKLMYYKTNKFNQNLKDSEMKFDVKASNQCSNVLLFAC